jgi:hypothetical protein
MTCLYVTVYDVTPFRSIYLDRHFDYYIVIVMGLK